jgi:hypothetical protein
MRKTTVLAEPGARPRLVRPSEEMKRLSAAFCEELLRWPDVRMRSMFGLRAFFRRKEIFALIPDKRAPESPNAIAYKLRAQAGSGRRKWLVFRIETEKEYGEAVSCLKRAYARAAGWRKKIRKPQTGR